MHSQDFLYFEIIQTENWGRSLNCEMDGLDPFQTSHLQTNWATMAIQN